ncbi:hypothetical protein SL1157_0191 [Ruegeria lacuscaerulensis ITI-1157]|nr:hypothetical protein SL1157_0191 [Ruegeria lacuscaerulensis ITI-1157]
MEGPAACGKPGSDPVRWPDHVSGRVVVAFGAKKKVKPSTDRRTANVSLSA